MTHADKRPVGIFVLSGGNFFSLLINVNTDFFNNRRLRLTLCPAVDRRRFVLNGNRLDFVRLILPLNSNESTTYTVHIIPG
jgi:hypothetical protein